jgi:hypothetical protein
MAESEQDPPGEQRAIMLGIRHRCGQEVQFWIPAYLISAMLERIGDNETLDLTAWMHDEGLLPEAEAKSEDLLEHLRKELAPRGVALIHVEEDPSICPACGVIIPWVEAITEWARSKRRES